METFFDETTPPIKQKHVSTSIMELITSKLFSGELKPGDKLPTETEFAQKMGVGRNSYREAIKMLTSLGVVEIRRGEGTFIAKEMSSPVINPLILSMAFEPKTTRELIELRLILDIGAAELVIKRVTEEGIRALEEVNEMMYREAKQEYSGPSKLFNYDLKFHKIFYKMADNRLLKKTHDAIYALFHASMQASTNQNPIMAYEYHKLIIDALRTGDLKQVQESIRKSLSFWIELLDRSSSARSSDGK